MKTIKKIGIFTLGIFAGAFLYYNSENLNSQNNAKKRVINNSNYLYDISKKIKSEKSLRNSLEKDLEILFNESSEEEFSDIFFGDCKTDFSSKVKSKYLNQLGYDSERKFSVEKISVNDSLAHVFDKEENYLEFKIVDKSKFVKSCDFIYDDDFVKLSKTKTSKDSVSSENFDWTKYSEINNDNLNKEVLDEVRTFVQDFVESEQSMDADSQVSYYNNKIMWNGKLKDREELRKIHHKFLDNLDYYNLSIPDLDIKFNSEGNAMIVEYTLKGEYSTIKSNSDKSFEVKKRLRVIELELEPYWRWRVDCEEYSSFISGVRKEEQNINNKCELR